MALIVIEVFISPSGMPSNSVAHVAEMGDRHADLADLAAGERVVAVVAGLGRQIEGDREAGLALGEIAAGRARSTLRPSNGRHRCGTARACRAAAGFRLHRRSPAPTSAHAVTSFATAIWCTIADLGACAIRTFAATAQPAAVMRARSAAADAACAGRHASRSPATIETEHHERATIAPRSDRSAIMPMPVVRRSGHARYRLTTLDRQQQRMTPERRDEHRQAATPEPAIGVSARMISDSQRARSATPASVHGSRPRTSGR